MRLQSHLSWLTVPPYVADGVGNEIMMRDIGSKDFSPEVKAHFEPGVNWGIFDGGEGSESKVFQIHRLDCNASGGFNGFTALHP